MRRKRGQEIFPVPPQRGEQPQELSISQTLDGDGERVGHIPRHVADSLM